EQERWTLDMAMRTIAGAQDTPFGRATSLIGLSEGKPIAPIPRPYPAEKMHADVRDMDWTKYSGYYDTDHSIRDEFFHPAAERRPSVLNEGDWLADLTYIYDRTSADHRALMAGEVVSEGDVESELGTRHTWRR